MASNGNVKDYPLLTVCIVASLGMTLTMITGQFYVALIDYLYPKVKEVVYVDCSYDIKNMALKHNVTLLDKCVLEN